MSETKPTSPATDDLRIRATKQLMKPRELMQEIPVEADVAEQPVTAIKPEEMSPMKARLRGIVFSRV